MSKSRSWLWLTLIGLFFISACGSAEGRRKKQGDCQVTEDCPLVTEDGGPLAPCTVPSCESHVCEYVTAKDETPCDDGDEATSGDQCSEGLCRGSTEGCPDDPSSCQASVFDPATGQCVVRPKADGSTCSDSDACTQTDSCVAGACVGASPKTCDPADDCHVAGTCNPATGDCTPENAEDGTTCDDALACTEGDVCTGGSCAGTAAACDDGRDCSRDTCDDALGGCHSDVSACTCESDADCDDGNACNGVETCDSATSLCQGGNPVDCSELTDACHTGTCEPLTGECTAAPKANGTLCNDANECTRADGCQSGVCTGGDPVACGGAGQCAPGGFCDTATGQCSTQPAPDGTPCDDADPCTASDVCRAGGCAPGDPVICAPSDQCHGAGVCSAATGICSSPPLGDGTPCDDGDLCTQSDACQTGGCSGGAAVVCVSSDPCHAAGTCDSATGVCPNSALPDGTTCNDGLLCTTGDECTAGVCGGGATNCDDALACTVDTCEEALGGCTSNPAGCNCTFDADCDDGNACNGTEMCNPTSRTCTAGTDISCAVLDDACNIGACVPATGACVKAPRVNGTTCSDGNLCTQTDSCQNGACVGQNSVVCAASDQCHNPGSCDPGTGECSSPRKPDGSSCTDGNLCTRTDTCLAGACVGQSPVVCTASDQCHDPGTCSPATGTCTNPTKANGTSCSDGNLCTQADTCVGGACTGGAAVVCAASDQCHVAGTCSPATGVCSNPNKAGGSVCDDGNACTQADACRSGVCAGGNPVVCAASDQCHDPGTCSPTTGVCSNPAKASGAACSDGNGCTQTDTCQAGVCTGTNPVTCTASDQCHNPGVCAPATGACTNPQKAPGTTCNDGNACTQTDTCQSGACQGTNPITCAATDQCHDPGACNPASGTCTNPAKAPGTACNDGNACTQTDTCQNGACSGGNPVTCAATDQCHDPGTCSPTSGACTNPAKANGATCSDGNACTQADACQNGACTGANPVVCTALDQCHNAGTCAPLTGVCSTPTKADDTPCGDGNACTQSDTCQSGACTGANPVVCTASDQCHNAGTCNPANGSCSNPAKPAGAVCSDGDACTQSDTCQSGACAGSNPVLCAIPDQCHDPGTCNPANGLCSNPAKSNTAPCDDSDQCSQTDRCQNGTCQGSNQVVCAASDQCHNAGVCAPSTGLCSDPAKANDAPCNDGSACTQSDSCQSGGCVGGNPVVCTASDQCHNIGTCNPANGNCTNPVKPPATPCNDGLTCTTSDVCTAGTCGGSTVVCNDGISCTVDTCSEAVGGCTVDTRACGCAADVDCDDGNACNGVETCNQATLSCRSGTPMNCGAFTNACNTGQCNPDTGACFASPRADGTTCDDANACTQTDGCLAGACTGTNPITCAATDQCHDPGTCNPTNGVCSNPAKAVGTACNDGDACTQTDTCQGAAAVRACTGSNPITCAATDQCHDPGTCNPTNGACSNPAKAAGTSCNDGDACTQTDTCEGAAAVRACTGSNPVSCAATDQCHNPGTCNPTNGACSNPAKAAGTSCNDGDACTQTDTCEGAAAVRACTGSNPVSCAATDQCHDPGTCNPTSGACSNPAKAAGTSCNDGDACTQTDTCEGAAAVRACTGTNPVVCAATDQCHDPGACNPTNGACSNPAKAAGTLCDDGDLCTQTDTCQGAAAVRACTGTNPVVCTASDQCHNAGVCASSTGNCSDPPMGNGAPCDDGSACTQTDACQAGICTGASPVVCTASDQCHNAGTCNPGNGNCSNPAKADDAACNDGNACTQADTCQAGICEGATPVVCATPDQCHDPGLCQPASGTCTNPPKLDGATCADGTACTRTDTCQNGTCTGANPVVCTASDQCHRVGVCAPASGVCSNPRRADGFACNDTNACTQTDACQTGVCVGANPVVCAASDQCHLVGTCAPATGVCSNPNAGNGTGCNDGDQCTQTDACQAGNCNGTSPIVCTALSQCHDVGTCAQATGNCSNPPKAVNSSCDDANPCTIGDACNGTGSCSISSPFVCPTPDQCHNPGVCQPASGTCTNPAKANGAPCDDASSCTQTDACSAGVCLGDPRADKDGDWADAPGGPIGGPQSIDVFAYRDGTLGTVGVFTGDVDFAGKPLAFDSRFREGLYLATYAEVGSGGDGDSLFRAQIAGTQDRESTGSFTVGGAVVHSDDSFTVVGTVVGDAEFGSGAGAVPVSSDNRLVFVARFESDGQIRWVATGDASNAASGEAIAGFDDGSVVVSGVNSNDIAFTDWTGSVFGGAPGGGVYAARFDAAGTGVFVRQVAVPAARAFIGVASVTDHSDGSFTLLGGFTVQGSFGPGGELTQASQGALDAWILRLEPDSSYRWGARIGAAGNDHPGDVQRIVGDAVIVSVDTTGQTPNVDSDAPTPVSRDLHSLGGNNYETQLVRFDRLGRLVSASLIGDPNQKGGSQVWATALDDDGSITLAGRMNDPIDLYDAVGFGTGLPPAGTPSFTLTVAGGSPVLYMARYEATLRMRWAITVGGNGSGALSQTGWDLVTTAHPSLSATIAGMFGSQAQFGHSVIKTLTPTDKNGNPFIVHIDSEQELDFCP